MVQRVYKPLEGGGGGSEKALFITLSEPYHKATKSTVSGWVKDAISGAYSHLNRRTETANGHSGHCFQRG